MGSEDTSPAERRTASGFTWRSLTALIYSIIVFQPAAIYLWLVSHNEALFGAVTWATLILFVELTRLYGSALTKQEAAVIFLGAGVSTGTALFFQERIAGLYFRHSPAFASFGIADMIPNWYTPSLDSQAWYLRTFFHPDFLVPLLVPLIQFGLAAMTSISMGLLAHRIFVVAENLPFPVQRASAAALLTMTERTPERMPIFTLATLIGMFYSIFLYVIPFIGQTRGYSLQFIPVPWADFNSLLHRVLPGASFGVATDIAFVASGLVVPFNSVVSLFIGSFAFYFMGNALLVRQGATRFAQEWIFGMKVSTSYERSLLYAWASPIIGIAVAAGVLPLVTRPKLMASAFKTLGRAQGKSSSTLLILAPFLAGTLGSVALTHYLIPGFPVWILILLSVGWSLLNTMVSARTIGMAGVGFSVPTYPDSTPAKLAFIGSGYKGVDVYFTHKSLVVESGEGAGWAANFKILDLTDTSITSYLFVYLIALPIALIMSFLYMQNFWRIAPIPSARYPGVYIFWPVTATFRALWSSGALQVLDLNSMLYGFGSVSGIYLAVQFLHLPFSTISAVAGLITPIPTATTMLIGALIGRFIAMRQGKKWWDEYRAVISGGILLGEGMMVVVGSAIAMLLTATWFLPY